MLPDLIEIVPLDKPVQAQITVPGSKSITNRALILAALAKGETTLRGALWSEDTQVMVECLQKLGFSVKIDQDPDEFCNCILTVKGLGGEIPNAGTADKPLELFVGNAGTAARFLSALVCLGKGVYRLSGVPRMHERPQAALFKALRELGYHVDSANDKLPAVIHGVGPHAGKCSVSIADSSQFASALLLCAAHAGWDIEVFGENSEESPYIVMTDRLIFSFPEMGGSYEIEADASSASYFHAAAALAPPSWFTGEINKELTLNVLEGLTSIYLPEDFNEVRQKLLDGNQPKRVLEAFDKWMSFPGISNVEVNGMHALNISELQIDAKFSDVWPFSTPDEISRLRDLGDSIMTAITMTPLGQKSIRFTDLGRLRVQECERVEALRTELAKCGAKVVEEGDTLTVFPSELHGAEIEAYDDHRMAMCFAILGLKVPGIKIKNPACVKKTFPNFFQKLAAAPPAGLGTTILDARTGRKLAGEELFAD